MTEKHCIFNLIYYFCICISDKKFIFTYKIIEYKIITNILTKTIQV